MRTLVCTHSCLALFGGMANSSFHSLLDRSGVSTVAPSIAIVVNGASRDGLHDEAAMIIKALGSYS